MIASVVGGNRYMWFTTVQPAGLLLPIDDSYLDRNVPVSCSLPSGSAFPVGTTVVTCTATDNCGNESSCQFNVTVNDNQNPTVQSIPVVGAAIVGYTCGGTITLPTDANSCAAARSIIKPVWADNCAVVSSTAAANNAVTVSDFGSFITGVFPKGTTTITFTGTDAAGNMGTCTLIIQVNDNTPPSVTGCPVNITVSAAPNACSASVTWAEPTFFDNCPGVTVVQTSSLTGGLTNGSAFPLGTTTITYTATDAAGNVNNTCSFTITVNGVCANQTEFTTTFLIDAANFNLNQTRDAIYVIDNIGANPNNTQISILITRPADAFFSTAHSELFLSANVFGGVVTNNNDWVCNSNFIGYLCTSKPGVIINPGQSSIIGFQFTANGPSATINSKAQTVGQLLNGTGGDQNSNNNLAQSTFLIN
ncbi:MAG: HYR domain-containing protein [Saprospiraceae bacterium]|nr:HYR domain-containing protein [Saprospiraceae bacterium]